METILTTEEVAKRLKASPRAVRQWLQQGKLPGRRVGRYWFVSETVLADFLRGKAVAERSNGSAD